MGVTTPAPVIRMGSLTGGPAPDIEEIEPLLPVCPYLALQEANRVLEPPLLLAPGHVEGRLDVETIAARLAQAERWHHRRPRRRRDGERPEREGGRRPEEERAPVALAPEGAVHLERDDLAAAERAYQLERGEGTPQSDHADRAVAVGGEQGLHRGVGFRSHDDVDPRPEGGERAPGEVPAPEGSGDRHPAPGPGAPRPCRRLLDPRHPGPPSRPRPPLPPDDLP